MNLLKTSVLNGVAVLIKIATMFILNKILAVYVGPAGYAIIGQFQNFIQVITSFSGNAINTAIVKYTAEYGNDVKKQTTLWRSSFKIILIFSTIVSFLIFAFNHQLSDLIFKSQEYSSILLYFALFLVFFNLNSFFIAVLNGKKEVKKLVGANIGGSIFSLVITSLLAIYYNLHGALIALSIYQSLSFVVTLLFCLRSEWFRYKNFLGKIDIEVVKNLGAYALMAIVSAICLPLSQMVIRLFLVDAYGDMYAGYWEAMTRLSSAYLMVITMTLSVYYLPRLSELTSAKDVKKEIILAYKFLLPLAVVAGFVIYVMQDWIIALLFSKDFLPMKELFFWQVIGDGLKIGSWILAYVMLSKAMTKLYIATEIIFAASSVIFSIWFANAMGFEGISFAYFVNYGLYFASLFGLIFYRLGSFYE